MLRDLWTAFIVAQLFVIAFAVIDLLRMLSTEQGRFDLHRMWDEHRQRGRF